MNDLPSAIGFDRTRDQLVSRLWRGNDPFYGFPAKLFATDFQGWNSEHAYLVEAIRERRPRVVVEIGVWKGASVITMARELQSARIDGVVIAVDTWLGSWEHWFEDNWHPALFFEHGYPRLNRTFMANIMSVGLQEFVLPLPLDSTNAGQLLKAYDIRPDVIHLDGAHDYRSVQSDLEIWWSLLKEGGLFIGDDYFETEIWPEVKSATDAFFAITPHSGFEHHAGKFRAVKS